MERDEEIRILWADLSQPCNSVLLLTCTFNFAFLRPDVFWDLLTYSIMVLWWLGFLHAILLRRVYLNKKYILYMYMFCHLTLDVTAALTARGTTSTGHNLKNTVCNLCLVCFSAGVLTFRESRYFPAPEDSIHHTPVWTPGVQCRAGRLSQGLKQDVLWNSWWT